MKREDRYERKPRQPETSHRSVCGRSRLKYISTFLAYLFLFKRMESKLIMSIKSVLARVLELHAAQLT
ncbi:hypothetical protein ALC62_04360 [Cyphomyrmex costatus]|uniref:Uncharacterized protein n=1 Tax=Cyphomyrmex costatus TaxID=456900 RepID=A0A195CVR5_9HYME|nr:hypothetical protein ALC62_04360 [Cyphomyrmex costatus]